MKKKSYVNPHVEVPQRGFKDFLLWKLGHFDSGKTTHAGKEGFSFPSLESSFNSELPSVTWINHSTFLISVCGVNILTDPIWSSRCSPLSFLGPKRKHPPGVPFSHLPHIDFVLISHNHYDHLDQSTVVELAKKFTRLCWFVPKGVKSWFDLRKITPVYEFDWWDQREVVLSDRQGVKGKITFVPAQHFSGRRGYDLNGSLWGGWIFEGVSKAVSKRCYFVGDTGYNPVDFKKIGELFAPIDLSLIPIGAYEPKAFMEAVHINPEQAVRIHREVGSNLSIGMHWKTFRLTDEPMDLPPYELYQALLKEKIDPSHFVVIEPGQARNW